MIRVTGNIFIDESEIQEEFMRSGGPGGQHVNKVSTAVQLRFDIMGSKLPQEVKERLSRLGGRRVTEEGVLILSARGSRSREMNRKEAMEKLLGLIRKAAEAPRKRIKTRPSFSAKQKRVDRKKVRGGAKKMRKKVKGEE
ncbi:MAG: alternative ribosome rescue aminoacyl-tRNA hydrolase ArfB [Deltaproteobacteria bacterium]|nr:alternative ribosome rescue aminoacyl-tRNA hydrolase ArfB [Deltaproteobacteria bacterium]